MTLKLSSVASQVIAGVLIAAVLGVAASLWSFAPQVWQWVLDAAVLAKNASAWLLGMTEIPHWCLLLLAAGWIPTLKRLIDFARRKKAPSVKEYSQDDFFGVRWRWSFDMNKSPVGLKPFCPTCDMEGIAICESTIGQGTTTTLICERCNRRCAMCDGNTEALTSAVARLIERKIRTGEWLRVVESQRSE